MKELRILTKTFSNTRPLPRAVHCLKLRAVFSLRMAAKAICTDTDPVYLSLSAFPLKKNVKGTSENKYWMLTVNVKERAYWRAHLLFCLGNCLNGKWCSVHGSIRFLNESSEFHGYQALAILKVQALPSLLVSAFAKDTSANTGAPWQGRNGRLPDPLPHTSARLPYRSHGCLCAQHKRRTAILVTFLDSFKAASSQHLWTFLIAHAHPSCPSCYSKASHPAAQLCHKSVSARISVLWQYSPAWQIHHVRGNHQIDPMPHSV